MSKADADLPIANTNKEAKNLLDIAIKDTAKTDSLTKVDIETLIAKDKQKKAEEIFKKAHLANKTTISEATNKGDSLIDAAKRSRETEKEKLIEAAKVDKKKLLDAAITDTSAIFQEAKKSVDSLMKSPPDSALKTEITKKRTAAISKNKETIAQAKEKGKRTIDAASFKYSLDGQDFFDKLFYEYGTALQKYSEDSSTILEKDVSLVLRDTCRTFHFVLFYNEINSSVNLISTYKGLAHQGLVKKYYQPVDPKDDLFTSLLIADKTIKGKLEETDTIPFISNTSNIEIALSNSIEKGDYNERLRKIKLRDRWVVGINMSPGLNYRQTEIAGSQLENAEQLARRNANEISRFTCPAGAQLGYAWGVNMLTASYTLQEYGFYYNKPDSINWSTGAAVGGTKVRELQRVNSFGLHYTYYRYDHTFSPYVTGGLFCSFAATNGPKDVSNSRNRYFSTGFKGGLGLNYSPCYHLNFHFNPVLYYNLSTSNGTALNTRFYTYGFEIGAFYNLSWLRK